MKQRPILVATIGYIIGILWGLYFKISIVLYYILSYATYYLIKKIYKNKSKRKFKLLSFSRYKKYLKLIITNQVVMILIISSIISNTIIILQNQKYENLYKDGENIEIQGIVVSQKKEKQYYNLYQVKLKNQKNSNLYIQVSKKEELEYGDKIKLQGEFKRPEKQRNYKGYDDEKYLKTLKIVGRVKVTNLQLLDRKQLNPILQKANDINSKLKEKIEELYEKENASILKGLLLGETDDIQEDIKENFQISNISHVLAISGMHIGYIIMGISLLCSKLLGKRKTQIVTIAILILYSFITGFSPSIVRAVVMSVLVIGAKMLNRKSDVWNILSISLLGILIYNPFLILNIGLQLSYLATIGILLLKPVIGEKIKIKEILLVSLSAQIMILPVLLYNFNIVGIYFLITNLLVSMIIGTTVIIGFSSTIIAFIFKPLAKIIAFFLNFAIDILQLISKLSELPFAKIYFATPSILAIILYFVTLAIMYFLYPIYHLRKLTQTQKRVKNIISLFHYKFNQKRSKYIMCIIIVFSVCVCISILPKDLKVYFVDVGQGDCTFIVTPTNKTILVDGGGSLNKDFDVGKKTVLPYLLDRGYSSIDYIVISHFDQDHVQALLYVMQEIKVRNVIIGKQLETCENYEEFKKIVKEKNINIKVVEAGNHINIEKDLYFDVLWPSRKRLNIRKCNK